MNNHFYEMREYETNNKLFQFQCPTEIDLKTFCVSGFAIVNVLPPSIICWPDTFIHIIYMTPIWENSPLWKSTGILPPGTPCPEDRFHQYPTKHWQRTDNILVSDDTVRME